MPGENKSDTGRELIFSRLLDYPLEQVWKAWTNPEHIQHWWGPNGFKNTITKMDVRTGGEWLLVMHDPNGSDYHQRCLFREVVKHKKIVYEQLTQFRYIATVDFERKGNKTLIRWQLLFESREYMIEAAKAFGVDEGLIQTAERLISYLSRSNIKNK